MKVLIGIPSMDMVPAKFMMSLVALDKPEHTDFVNISESLIYDARDKIVQYAINGGYDYLFFLDSDIICESDTLTRLLNHKADIVSGLYFGRRENAHDPIAYELIAPKTIYRKASLEPIQIIHNYAEVSGVGLGCCLIKVDVLKKMQRKNKNMFEPYRNLGEDVAWCYRARKKGYKIMLDSTVRIKHLGQKEYGRLDYERTLSKQ